MMAADNKEFDYLAEQAKVDFQANISSLLELQAVFNNKLSAAQEQQKKGVFLTNSELEVFKDWLLQSATNLMADYTLIDRTNRLTNKLYQVSIKLAHKNTPNLKDLVA